MTKLLKPLSLLVLLSLTQFSQAAELVYVEAQPLDEI